MRGRHYGTPKRRDRALPARDAYKLIYHDFKWRCCACGADHVEKVLYPFYPRRLDCDCQK